MPTRVLTPNRLNALVSPQGWTRSYETVTMNNITRTKRNAEIVTGKILVTCKVTIDGLGTHAGTGPRALDDSRQLAQGSTAVGKSGREFASGDANGCRCEQQRYVDSSEQQQGTFFRNQ
jgi:hypothetical protein